MQCDRFLGLGASLRRPPRRMGLDCVALLAVSMLGSALLVAPAPALPAGRVYELVSPVYKNGYGTNAIAAVAPNGESVAFKSKGAFAGDPDNEPLSNSYLSRRGEAGWSTMPVNPPTASLPFSAVGDFSGTLESSLSAGTAGSSYQNSFYTGTEFEFLLHSSGSPDTAANFALAGVALEKLDHKPILGAVSYEGASPDFSHLVFGEADAEPLLPGAGGKAAYGLYDLETQSAGGTPGLRLVGLNNQGKALSPECNVGLGASTGRTSSLNAVAGNGEEIFFTTGAASEGGRECAKRQQLFVRLGGSKTIEVSRPLSSKCVEVPCLAEVPSAAERSQVEFQGASEDGSRVFFTTAQPLVPGDTDSGNDLYMASIGCAAAEVGCEPSKREVTSLVQVSHGSEPAALQGVMTVASDGSRAYFVAHGVLSAGTNSEGSAPTKGADNLYAYDSVTGAPPAFIGELCSGPELSGEAEDVRCPPGLQSEGTGQMNDTSLWLEKAHGVQTNSCGLSSPSCEPGRFLVFNTYARLSDDDTDSAVDVYRYDAQTGRLARVSAGEGGYDANGNATACSGSACDATIHVGIEDAEVAPGHDLDSRAISEDGSRVVFTTAGALSPAAINGLANVYEWHEAPGSGKGEVSLISAGSSTEPVEDVVISSSGRDIFFSTTQGLVAQDTDGQTDVYDARLEGGFPSSPVEPQACEGDACQGPLTNPAPLLVPGSASQAAGGNFLAPTTPAPAKAVTKPKGTTSKCAKRLVSKKGKCVKRIRAKKSDWRVER
jgi:hypothetical protein